MVNNDNRTEQRHSNGIDYIYEWLSDGWIAIYKLLNSGTLRPLIQALTEDKYR